MITFQLRELKIAHAGNEFNWIIDRVNADATVNEVAYFKTIEKTLAESVVAFLNSIANWGMPR